jgi:hypothetical protein
MAFPEQMIANGGQLAKQYSLYIMPAYRAKRVAALVG